MNGDGESKEGQEEEDGVKGRGREKGKIGRGERGGTTLAISRNGIAGKNKKNAYPAGSGDQVSLTPKHTQDLLQDLFCSLEVEGLVILK